MITINVLNSLCKHPEDKQNKLMIPHSLTDSYSCRNEICAAPGKAVSSWEKSLLPQAWQQTQECPARPCLQLMTTRRRTGLVAQGSLSSLLKPHRSFSAEATASKLLRKKIAYEMWFMVLRWVKKMRVGLGGTVTGTGRKGGEKMCPQPECSVTGVWCRYPTHCCSYCSATRNCCQTGNPLSCNNSSNKPVYFDAFAAST